MQNKILIAYATNCGSTAEIANFIQNELAQNDIESDVRPIKEITTVEEYGAVLVGAPMIFGWHRDAMRFLKKHRSALSTRPVACFMTAMRLTQTNDVISDVPVFTDPILVKMPENPKKLNSQEKYSAIAHYLKPVLKAGGQNKPAHVAFFKGKIELPRLSLLAKLFVLLVIRAQPGDYRNWEAIRQWSHSLKPLLSGQARLAGD